MDIKTYEVFINDMLNNDIDKRVIMMIPEGTHPIKDNKIAIIALGLNNHGKEVKREYVFNGDIVIFPELLKLFKPIMFNDDFKKFTFIEREQNGEPNLFNWEITTVLDDPVETEIIKNIIHIFHNDYLQAKEDINERKRETLNTVFHDYNVQ